MPSAQTIRFTEVQSQTSSTTSLRFDLPLLSSTHIAHYAITALAKRDSNIINKGNTSRNIRSHSAIYRVGRDFFTGLQKHVSVTTGVLLCSLMFSAAHRMSRGHRTRVTTHGGPGGLARCRARFHNLAPLRFLSVDSHRFLSVDPRRFPSLLRC